MTRIILVTLACAFLLQSCCKCPKVDDNVSGGCGTDCLSFEPLKVRAVEENGNWTLVEGNMAMLYFGANQAEAETALKIIQHYKMNKQCFVGRPDASMEYYLVNGQSPVGAFTGEDCTSFNPATIQLDSYTDGYRIVDGSHILLDFGLRKGEAYCALELIQKFGFTKLCFVGRPDPSMVYFRK